MKNLKEDNIQKYLMAHQTTLREYRENTDVLRRKIELPSSEEVSRY